VFAPKKILVPTDFSEFSDNALTEAMSIASRYDSTITLLHVVGLTQQCSVDYCLPENVVENVRSETMRSARELVEKQIARVTAGSKVQIVTDVREASSPSEEIVREQKAKEIDLIVIASHGKTGILGHLLGSVAERVTRNATCPVYVVKPQK
jgi:universal stress protein A